MSVYPMLSSLKGYLKKHSIVYENAIFRIHYVLTPTILLICCLLIGTNEFFGGNIMCITDGSVPDNIINTYCWIMTTFTMPDAHKREIGTEVAHPGVGTYDPDGAPKKHHAYYQWVVFVLFFQVS